MPRSRPAAALALAWLAGGVAVLLALLGMAVWAQGDRGSGDWQWTLPVAAVYAPAGIALVRRSPLMAGTFLVMALSAGTALLAGEQAEAVAEGRSATAGSLAVWLSSWTWVPSYLLLLSVLPHLLPSGRPLPGRWRWGWRLAVVAAVTATLGWALTPYDALDEPSDAALALQVANPVGIRGAAALIAAGAVLSLLAAAAGLAALVARWRRSSDRQSLRWVLGGISLTLVLLGGSLLVPGGSPGLMALGVLPLPASVLVGTAASAARLDSQLRQARTELAVAQAEERQRLRHELHDSLGPALAGIALQLEHLPSVVATDAAKASELTSRLTSRVQEAVADVRRLVEGLGPDSSLGLEEALRAQVSDFDAPSMRSALVAEPAALSGLPAAVEVVTMRVVGEALTNASRHAQADRCTVDIHRTRDALTVAVRDNGQGITAARATGSTSGSGVGLLSMHAVAEQIGGSCDVADAQGGGTEVRLVLPLGQS